jgi:creatinine amidohydrolase
MNRFDVPGIPPDHAGQFKTTSLSGLAPDLVDRGMLSDAADTRDRMDPRSPLWGIIGADPRATPPPSAAGIVAHIVAAVCAKVGPRTTDAA